PAGTAMTIRVGDLRVPGTDLVHTKLLLSTSPKDKRTGFWFRMYWNGGTEMSGGYAPVGLSTTTSGARAQAAPVFRPCPAGPLSFACYSDGKLHLRAGTKEHLNVIAGNAGSGPDTLAVVDEKFLDLGKDALTVTVIAKDGKGAEVKATTRIKEHC